jgi:hypothetical protein
MRRFASIILASHRPQVVRALCAWSPAAPKDLWLEIAAAIEEALARLLNSKIVQEGWGSNVAVSEVSAKRRGSVFQTVTFGSAASTSKIMTLHIENFQKFFDNDTVDSGSIPLLIEFANRESMIDLDLMSPSIVDIAIPGVSVEEKRKATLVGSRAIYFCVTKICLSQLVDEVGDGGTINNKMIAGCVALEAFEEQFIAKGIIEPAEGHARVQIDALLEKTKRQVTVRFNALFEGVVKAETFSDLSQVDGSSSSSNDVCMLLKNVTKHFIAARVPLTNHWWVVSSHVMMSLIDRYMEFNANTGDIPNPVLPKPVHKTGAFAMFKSSDTKHVIPGGRRSSLYDFSESALAAPEGTTLWGPRSEHKRLSEQRTGELVARYCNMEKVAEFLASLETDLRGIFNQTASSEEYERLPMAVELEQLLGRVQSRKKKVLSYLSHKIVLFDLYEPLCDRLFAPDPSQKNPVARPFRITPLLNE